MPTLTRAGGVLTSEDRERITYLYDQGVRAKVNADKFGCSTVSVWRIAHRTPMPRCDHCGATLRPEVGTPAATREQPGDAARTEEVPSRV